MPRPCQRNGHALVNQLDGTAQRLQHGLVIGNRRGNGGMALGVIVEAIYVNLRAKPILTTLQRDGEPTNDDLQVNQLLRFYSHLAVTPLLTLLALPIGTAAVARMPEPLRSFAMLPVVAGLSFTFRSLGLAYQEVVVALVEKPGFARALQSFAFRLAFGTSFLLGLIAATPLSDLWFKVGVGLPSELAILGETALWFTVLMPACTVLESWDQGMLLHHYRTHAITESVLVYLLTCSVILWVGVYSPVAPGLYATTIRHPRWLAFSNTVASNQNSRDLGQCVPRFTTTFSWPILRWSKRMLIVGGLEMPGGAMLPGKRSLASLFEQAFQIDFSSAKEFRIPILQ